MKSMSELINSVMRGGLGIEKNQNNNKIKQTQTRRHVCDTRTHTEGERERERERKGERERQRERETHTHTAHFSYRIEFMNQLAQARQCEWSVSFTIVSAFEKVFNVS